MNNIANGIYACLTNFDKIKYLDQYKELYIGIFKTTLTGIDKVISYSEDEHKAQSVAIRPEVQMLDGVIDVFVQIAFKISFMPIANKDPEIWTQLTSLCQKLIGNEISKKMVVKTWRVTILSLNTNLVDALCKMTPEEIEVLSEVTPFKDFPMRNEYGLQVLFNAFASKDDPKYAKVIELKLYNELYENWHKLLQLLKISIELNNTEILLLYYKSIITINK